MPDWNGVGKLLVLLGAGLVLVGGLIIFLGKFSSLAGEGAWLGWLGKLPGDISIKRNGFSFHAPLTTCLLISIALSVLYYLVSFLWKR